MRTLMKTSAQIIQAVNNFFEEFDYPNIIDVIHVLTEREELDLMQLLEMHSSEDEQKARARMYEMYCFTGEG